MENVENGKSEDVRDFRAFFGIRAIVFFFLCLAYYFVIEDNISYFQLFITSALLFSPFFLEYYPREGLSTKGKYIRKAGMLVPIGVIGSIFGTLLWAVRDESIILTEVPFELKLVCYSGCVLVVFLAALDYNDVKRNGSIAVGLKNNAKEYVEKTTTESIEARMKRLEHEKKEGFRKVALQSQGQNPNHFQNRNRQKNNKSDTKQKERK